MMTRMMIGYALLAAWLFAQAPALAEPATPPSAPPEATAGGFLGDWFRNREQRGRAALEQQQYDKAAELFADPYRQGIAHYRAGDYAAAERSFRGAGQDQPADNPLYNLGNSLFRQQRYQDAVQAYDQVLANHPDHEDARFNRELAQRLQQQQQQQQQGQNSDGQNPSGQQQPESQNNGAQPSDQQQGEGQAPGTPPARDQTQDATDQDQSGSPAEDQAKAQAAPQPDKGATEQQGETAGQASPHDDGNDETGAGQHPGAVEGKGDGAEELAAQRWLNRLEDNPRQLLKNQFRLREQQADVRQGDKPW